MAILLHPYGSLVLALVRGFLRVREVLRPLPARFRVSGRHGAAHRREAHGGSGDLIPRRPGEVTQVMRVGDERTTPFTEGVTRLSDPVDIVDVAFEFVGCCPDGITRIPQGLARGFQILGVRPLNEVNQLIEVEVTLLEVCPIRDSAPERSIHEGRAHHAVEQPTLRTALKPTDDIRDAVLPLNAAEVRLVLFISHRHAFMPLRPSLARCLPSWISLTSPWMA
ncbi:hypothetical protein ABT147_19140 [Streptomyces sp. NPDC001868]|uniref:hypothetical protein n=1 Tax=Streptomyces sp. NPDC001868 TaxID=3154401 RepID=UPI00331C5186